MNNEHAREAFTAARQIAALLEDLHTAMKALAKDSSIPDIQRHLIMQQMVDLIKTPMKKVEEMPSTFLEHDVQHCIRTRVEGMSIRAFEDDDGIEGRLDVFIAGMVYEHKKTKKVEILNKDKASWTKLLQRFIDLDMADAVQQRLTLSKIDSEATLEALDGLVGIVEDGRWSITKPQEAKKK